MKKLNREKLKEIGKKIGIFIAVIFVFFSWFLMGVRYGRNHPKNNTTASADDISALDSKQTYYIPLCYGDPMFIAPFGSGVPHGDIMFRYVAPKSYLILQDGTADWTIGSYGSRLSDYTTCTLDLEDTTKSHIASIDLNYVATTNFYDYVSFMGDFEVLDNGRLDDIDFSSIDDYRVVGVSVNLNYFTSNMTTLVNDYYKQTIVYDINFAIGEDDTIHFKIAYYPSYLYYEDYVGDIYDFSSGDMAFYIDVNDARSVKIDLPFNNYSIGFYDGYASGFNSGSNEGFTSAYNKGYNQGFSDGNTDGNSLRDVVRTAIETPVNMFKTVLNWNFLGYNLFTLFSTIITIIVVVFIVKKLL